MRYSCLILTTSFLQPQISLEIPMMVGAHWTYEKDDTRILSQNPLVSGHGCADRTTALTIRQPRQLLCVPRPAQTPIMISQLQLTMRLWMI